MNELLNINNLNFSYKNNIIFNDLSLFIEKSSYNILLGSNKSGKTTLFDIISKKNKSFSVYHSRSVIKQNLKSVKYILCSIKGIDIEFYNDIIDFFSLRDLEFIRICDLNKVNSIRVKIAEMILRKSSLLLLDDIYDDISYSDFNLLNSLIIQAIKKYGISVIISTSKLDHCVNCSNIMFLNNLKIELSGNFEYMISRDNVLLRNGIDISNMLDLSLKLKMYNLISEIVYNPRELVDELWN